MSSQSSRPSTMPWPPLIYVSAIALAIIANWLFPLPWIPNPLGEILFAVGLLLCALALAMFVSAIRTLLHAKTTVKPHQAATHLVTKGPFAFSRNPIYLGNTAIMLGLALITGIIWFIIFAIVAAFATQKLAIEPEERHLEAQFGKRFRDYCKKVRRWI